VKTALVAFVLLLALPIMAQPGTEESRGSFRVVDIYLDSQGAPLAAYQVTISVTNADAKMVGIEGGEHPAFRQPPLYDPKAMQRERVVIAAFNTGSTNELPHGKTRVATIHFQTHSDKPLQCIVNLNTAGNPEGTKIAVEATWEERKTK
jgi:hypothetical protein